MALAALTCQTALLQTGPPSTPRRLTMAAPLAPCLPLVSFNGHSISCPSTPGQQPLIMLDLIIDSVIKSHLANWSSSFLSSAVQSSPVVSPGHLVVTKGSDWLASLSCDSLLFVCSFTISKLLKCRLKSTVC